MMAGCIAVHWLCRFIDETHWQALSSRLLTPEKKAIRHCKNKKVIVISRDEIALTAAYSSGEDEE